MTCLGSSGPHSLHFTPRVAKLSSSAPIPISSTARATFNYSDQTTAMEGDLEALNGSDAVAPFIMTTYQMVNDPSNHSHIFWGGGNNSFVVADPMAFSQRILPSYFKHNNFSSFTRQLNTYGFRKVDPDRWEFANRWFLRGQKQLLNNIARRRHHNRGHGQKDAEELLSEISMLRKENSSMEEELRGMSERLEAMERRPQQMLAFLYKVIEDPDILPRMVSEIEHRQRGENRGVNRFCEGKKRRMELGLGIVASVPASSSSCSSGMAAAYSVKSEEDGVVGSYHRGCFTSSPEEGKGNYPQFENEWEHDCDFSEFAAGMNSPRAGFGGEIGFFWEAATPYPFSLFGGGY